MDTARQALHRIWIGTLFIIAGSTMLLVFGLDRGLGGLTRTDLLGPLLLLFMGVTNLLFGYQRRKQLKESAHRASLRS